MSLCLVTLRAVCETGLGNHVSVSSPPGRYGRLAGLFRPPDARAAGALRWPSAGRAGGRLLSTSAGRRRRAHAGRSAGRPAAAAGRESAAALRQVRQPTARDRL